MNRDVHRFRIGAFDCMAINDGNHTYAPPKFPPPAVLLFASAPQDALGPALTKHDLSPDSWNEWTSPYTCLVIDTGTEKILVDTGTGGFAPGTGRLVKTLSSEGIAPADIGTVVVTHGHPDHVGGCTNEAGDPTFPNARYVMSKAEHEFWTTDEAARTLDEHIRDVLVGVARRNLEPIASQLDLLTEESDVLPGVRAVPAPGHTPGLTALAVSSEGQEFYYLSDLVLHPVQVEQPHFCGVVDVAHGLLVDTRRRLLKRVARQGALALAFHFPFPSLGRVVEDEETWRWQPEADG